MTKKNLLLVIVVFLLSVMGALAQDDVKMHQTCPVCGMDRGQFSHSRVLIDYDDGTSFGACSLHCAAIELAVKIDKTPTRIRVGDFNSKTLIDAEKAVWVMGGNKPGVMTKRAKWAFEKGADADKFVAENGGSIITFDQAIKAAYEDMYQDTRMIREKRKMMKMKKMQAH